MLSIEDRVAIENLYARYYALIDTGDYRSWSLCFTEDAFFRGTEEARGRAAIADLGRRRVPGPASPRINRQHWNNNLILAGDGRSARGLCYLINVGQVRATGEITIATQGMYQDELVKLAGRWLFKSRKIHFDTPTPDVIPCEGEYS